MIIGCVAMVAVVVWLTISVVGDDDCFTLSGSVALASGSARSTGEACEGEGSYGDIRQGAPVTVYGTKGIPVASGILGRGTATGPAASVSCTFAISVSDVPYGSPQYQIEVANRGRTQVRVEEAAEGHVTVSLGARG
ncbi:hypothetical protein F0L68_07665 [Solihabitans fulvus]|uniref:Uncharacterized protein n=1 Tax=Solihabitans fulvus TaxID=1892852 RepID=A0A5B2XMV5_9PSEU|nr:hypothetical protein [Solihabitans fulvus]KAA2264290.1 hypothetical protein F0L68_07665 [Solihabitans fulvus]